MFIMSVVTPVIPPHVLRLLMQKPCEKLDIEELQLLFPHQSFSFLLELLWKLKELGFGTTTVAMYVLATHPELILLCSSIHTVSLAIMAETLIQWRGNNPELFPESECSQVHAGAAPDEEVIIPKPMLNATQVFFPTVKHKTRWTQGGYGIDQHNPA